MKIQFFKEFDEELLHDLAEEWQKEDDENRAELIMTVVSKPGDYRYKCMQRGAKVYILDALEEYMKSNENFADLVRIALRRFENSKKRK